MKSEMVGNIEAVSFGQFFGRVFTSASEVIGEQFRVCSFIAALGEKGELSRKNRSFLPGQEHHNQPKKNHHTRLENTFSRC
ncbi:hypothetical protein ACFP2F_04930 [Hymenobacter artigasi]|uniref:Uncharacterized protein n=1 Tax=Hymenobacter artigasi TaxID=2719616 RepID=A0ABX1HFD8_9BACT|nr:hypothetical protein [Hymenobacter artigasi]NKI88954.1 hypothetical protein [Hymenobacter artigasi]